MDKILAELDFVKCYIDDILVFSDTVEQHQIHLQIVFEWLKAYVQQAKVEAMACIPQTDVSIVCAFMGLANYYRRYVEFTAIAKPLNLLLKSDQEWQWGDKQERTFVEFKARLVAAPILRRLIRVCPYQLHTD
ncbi:hypothetical protein AXG93_3052s1120 [Marchantia polymorpha subsp. ruderalis]|uniref:Reverse transcriptase domain-containing protein n=1 Tax=Marchantia polymorpha subsp. ruderalis TaxID=1480154 RepID=A0A176WKN7_MARPO|nr:hypothetical protein AXG93_3052s1120 [Marchantia polymorpha subsp. ruderalis]